jgi:peptidoglycan/LPS O-acetylase OafA/YrhL
MDRAPDRLRSLQILRAIAAASVVYFHVDAAPVFGSFGIDIFFVISGFVMAMLVAHGQGARAFAIGRLVRIVPLYWILTTVLLVLAAIRPDLLNSTTANLSNYLKSLLFIPHFKENGSLTPMLAVGWTLNYEMFFYLCVWISIVVSRRFWMPIVLLLLTAAWLGPGLNSDHPVLRGFFGSTLLFEFALGFLAYRIYTRRWLNVLGAPALALIATLSYVTMAAAEAHGLGFDRLIIHGVPSLLLVSAATALEHAGFIAASRVTDLLSTLGDGSYATYLSHLYVVEGMRKVVFPQVELIDLHSPMGVLMTLTCALAVGHVLYVLLDRPLTRYFKRKFLPA